jgi:hypothetical protein
MRKRLSLFFVIMSVMIIGAVMIAPSSFATGAQTAKHKKHKKKKKHHHRHCKKKHGYCFPKK